FIFSLITMMFYCAKQGAPGGGPVDKEPPGVIKTIPKTDSIGIPLNLKEIYIEFSERMDEGSIGKAIFISPPLEFEYKWSRSRKLRLSIDDTLNADQTYVVSIGTEASDEHSNKLDASFQFAFSTGQKIDRGSIGGRVYGAGKNETYHIFAFTVNDSAMQDFIDLKPRYISQSGKDGQYLLSYLKPDTYRLIAVQDLNNNLIINADFEKLGIPIKDIMLTEEQLNYNGLNFSITKVDTVKPFFTGIRPVNDRYVQLRLSESILLNDKTDLYIIDSLSSDTLKVLGRSVNYESVSIIDIFTEKMDTSAQYQLFSLFIEDSSGNYNDKLQKVNFIPNMKTDTTALKVIAFTPADSAKSVHPLSPVYLEFSRPMNWSSVINNFHLTTGIKDTLSGKWTIKSMYDAEYYPDIPFISDSSYTVILDCGKVSDLWGKIFEDSLIHHYFSTVSSRDLGDISGMVSTEAKFTRPVYLSINNMAKGQGRKLYKLKLDAPGEYRFEQLPEDKYQLKAFWDLDDNGQYSAGDVFPFSFAEPFVVSDDTIKVRKRWETRGINIKLPDPRSE
ncbi:MAG: Ig-like domain-containing protein, partial [Calditrichaceae bacterium]|nr:Ig-like domain-containing protein [Calditrichaceae bacterium]